ncbi:acyltransferase family protein [Steroidobacter flavus]|uniref:Acyltransferase family protein n=1 Tax=Steroidobacter flavus TaxID=1842136 RepID=A0ABV8T4A5_9GAMM
MQYNPALDGIRALSILVVVFFHCEVPGVGGGFVGLDIFFVLSGFLITSLLAAEYRNDGIEIGRFYARRALRLYPTLLLLVAAYLVLAPLLWPTDDRWLSAVLASTYTMDYAIAFWHAPLTIAHTWSLGVEEKFYLLWPLLLPLILKARRPIAWLVAAFLVASAWRYFVNGTWGWAQAYFSFDTRMSGILLGAIAALVRPTISRRVFMIACVVLAVLIALPTVPSHRVDEADMWRITVAEFAAVVIVSYAAAHAQSRFLSSRPMVYIGKLSYGIYIWHFPLVVLLNRAYGQPWWVTLSATLPFAFAMAAICYHWVDAPIKRQRRARLGSLVGSQ